MAYVPTVWKNGDVITDVKMNKIEQGIANCYMPVLDLEDCSELDMTGLVFERAMPNVNGNYAKIYAQGESSQTPALMEDYLFYSAPPETYNAIVLATPMLVLGSGMNSPDVPSNYLGIGYATEQTFNGASDLEENNDSGLGTFNGTYDCKIIDIMSPLGASLSTNVTRIFIMSETVQAQLRWVDDPSGSSDAPVG